MRLSLRTLNISQRPEASKPAGGIEVVDSPSSAPSPNRFGPSTSEATAGVLPTKHIRPERRRQKRAGLKLSARVRPANLKKEDRYEVLVTLNASRESFYFITASERYQLGMRLLVTFPFSSAHDRAAITEDDGEVMRMEQLPSKRFGVAVQLRGPARTARAAAAKVASPASGGMVAERRVAARQPFSAEAVVIDPQANIRLQARCSDLSLEGCYVDTLNAFPPGTITQVELRTGDKVLEAIARVNSCHVGMGMGLCFQDLTPEQTSLLLHWLSDTPDERPWVASPSEPAKPAESIDRTLAMNMVRQMLSKGILTKGDISDILLS